MDGILISGGENHPVRDQCETACIDYCVKHRMPLFGVCHGMQFVGCRFGATLLKIDNHVNVPHEVHLHQNPYGVSKKDFEVNSFHRFTLDKIPDGFLKLASDENDHCEAMRHSTLPIVTFMWHPERPPYLDWFGGFIKRFYGRD